MQMQGRCPTQGPKGQRGSRRLRLKWLNYLIDLSNIPQTINSSYGSDELSILPAYAMSQFGRLGARDIGISEWQQ